MISSLGTIAVRLDVTCQRIHASGIEGQVFYPDRALVSEAHARGLKVIPWTCDDPATVEALMDMSVDGIITDYPNHVRQIMADRGMRLPKSYEPR